MNGPGLDPLNRRILEAMQQDCTLSMSKLAELTGSTLATCHRRLRSLIRSGLIEKQVAVAAQVHSLEPVTALFGLKLGAQGSERQQAARRFLKDQRSIRMLWVTTGEFDYVAVGAFEDVDALRQFVDIQISESEYFVGYRTFLSLEEIKMSLFRRFV